MTWKKVLLIIVAIIILIGGVSSVLYKRALTRAELTQTILIAKAQKLEKEKADIQKKFDLLGELSTLRITALQNKIIEKDRTSELILVKSAKQIKELRFAAGTWEDKYNRLEPECLQLSAKVANQQQEIGLLKLTIGEMEDRDQLRIANLAEVGEKLEECQKLLSISIANTKSILKKSFILKIFDRLSIVAGAAIGADGVIRPAIAAGVRIF